MSGPRATSDSKVNELVDAYEYDKNNWLDIRQQAAKDMRFVSGDPWDEEDKELRGDDRPTVAPEEMSQYRNQVVNALMSNPRGAKFSPAGNGADSRGAEFYQNKWREIEYRSHAPQQYVTVADHVLQRSYGFLRLNTAYASPRSANQDLWLEAFHDPDMCLPDTDCDTVDGSQATRFTAFQWIDHAEFRRKYPTAKTQNFSDFQATKKEWVQGSKILRAEVWRLEPTARKLFLVTPNAAPASRPGQVLGLGGQPAPPRNLQAFEDELPDLRAKWGGLTTRFLRDVDYPKIKQYFTNGIEILSEHDWAGLNIPIVYCFGKVLYVPRGGRSEKVILSMTRFGRDPWKAYCYACSQELEVLGMVPKAPLLAVAGQFDGYEDDVEQVMYSPKAYLYYKARTQATGDALLGPPIPLDYPVGQHLQALELVKEGFRRAIQSAMGANFLPTDAQKQNEKSGTALKKIDDVATQGTYHFVYAYDSMIRRAAVIGEDLMTPLFNYSGETAWRTADEKAEIVNINTGDPKNSYNTDGSYGVTVSTGPSNDSMRDAGEEFVNTMIDSIGEWMPVLGADRCAALLAILIRMRQAQLGPLAQQLADLVEPQQYKTEDGKPPDPRLLALQAQNQQLTQELQKLGFVIQTKQVEGQNKLQIARENNAATSFDKAADREVKLAIAELASKVERLSLFLDERGRVGIQQHDAMESRLQRTHEAQESAQDRVEAGRQREHERQTGALDRAHAVATGAAEAASAGVEQEREHAHQDQQRAAGARDALELQAASQPPEPPGGAGGQ